VDYAVKQLADGLWSSVSPARITPPWPTLNE
jgi:hypothetical protein